MNNAPQGKLTKPNKLVLPSLILAAISATLAPVAYITEAVQVYLFLVLPLGFGAALMAKIALNQIKRGNGSVLDRNLALLAYFLGLLPALSLCAVITFQMYAL
jgi:hypothetical protein